MTTQKNKTSLYWILAAVFALAFLFSWILLPEMPWIAGIASFLLVADLVALMIENKKSLRSRSSAYGFNSFITSILVIGIIGVLNFLGNRYPLKVDLTENKIHTLSDQSRSLVKNLKSEITATFFSKIGAREKYRPLFDNFTALNPKFKVEYVDPDKEPTKTKQSGITRADTLSLSYEGKISKVEEPTEEKLTNALIKLVKDKKQTVCSITGHGEKVFNGERASAPEGLEVMKKGLGDQSYELKEFSLPQETKIPSECDVLLVMGPTSSFFAPEVKLIEEYLEQGGRALFAVDINVAEVNRESAPELIALLSKWYVKIDRALVVDPFSRMMGVDASVPILATYNKDHAITKDFQENSFFPFSRPVDVASGVPESLKAQWLAKTTPKSWGEINLAGLSKGSVSYEPGKDKQGPLSVAVAVSGKRKDSKAARDTRIVVFGSALFASNNYSRFGGNSDFFLNSVSWLMEDESFISIRAKEEGAGKVEISAKTGMVIFWLTVILIPLAVAIAGVVIWVRRKKL